MGSFQKLERQIENVRNNEAMSLGKGGNRRSSAWNIKFKNILNSIIKKLTLKTILYIFIGLLITLFPLVFKYFYTNYVYNNLQEFLVSIHNSWFHKSIGALVKALYMVMPLIAFFVGYCNYECGFIARIIRGILTTVLMLTLNFYIAMAIFSLNISIQGNISVGSNILSNLSYDLIILIGSILGVLGSVLIIGGRQTQINVTLKSTTLDVLTALLTTVISIIICANIVTEDNVNNLLIYLLPIALLTSVFVRFILEMLVYSFFSEDTEMPDKHFVWGVMSSGLLSIIIAISLDALIASKLQEIWFFDLVNLEFIGFEKVPYNIYGDSNIANDLFTIDENGEVHFKDLDPFILLLIFISQIVLIWGVLADYFIEQLLWLFHKIDW